MNPTEHAALRTIAKDLRDASDGAILRVLDVIDRLPERGAADRLLEPLRPKLSALRPPRPVTFSRLLFTPLDPVIVPTSAWRPGEGSIPRTLIAPLSALIQPAMSHLPSLQASLGGQTPPAALWREAAAVLARTETPHAWNEPDFQVATGIRPKALPPLLAAIGLVFSHVDLFQQADRPLPRDAIRPALLDAARSGPTAWCIVLGLLFEQTTAPAELADSVALIAGETRIARHLTEGLQRVVAGVIGKLDQAPLDLDADRPASTAELDALSVRAARLGAFSALSGEAAGLAQTLAPRRKQMAAHCSEQIARGLETAAQACVPPGDLSLPEQDEAAERLESRLQALRRLELASRPLGDVDARSRLLTEAARLYGGSGAPAWLTRADRLRFSEILVGAEAALQLSGR